MKNTKFQFLFSHKNKKRLTQLQSLHVFKCNRKICAKYSYASKCKVVKNQIGVQFKRLYVCYTIFYKLLLFSVEVWRNHSTPFQYKIYFYMNKFFSTHIYTFSHTHMQIYKVLSSLSFLISAVAFGAIPFDFFIFLRHLSTLRNLTK